MTSWVVTTTTDYQTLDVADGDDIAVNLNGNLSEDIGWPGSDGSRDISGIIVNAGGIHIQDAGTRLDINDTYKIQVKEGGQWRSIGTSGSRCIIRGENVATSTHIIQTFTGGKLYFDYTDIDGFYYGVYTQYGGQVEMHNSTISGVGRDGVHANRAASVLLVNCSVASGGVYYCFNGADGAVITAIDCTLTSNIDNRLIGAGYFVQAIFANCTYQGSAIVADDFVLTSCDHDIRIYEKSTITETNSLSDVIIGASHPSMDSYGMLYDDTNYIKIPGCLNIPPTVTGVSNAYLLKKSAYWRSGLAVVSRTWKYWSDSGQAESGDNQKWTALGSKSGYTSDVDTDWAGNAMSITIVLGAGSNPPVISGATIVPSSMSQDDSVTIEWDATNMTSSDLSYVEFVGTGVIRKGASSDYAAYSVTISGEDLPVMTDNVVRIVAVNSDGWDTDESLTLTVTAVVPSVSYYKKEGIDVPDLPALVRQLLIDPLRNHLLYRIVPEDKIVLHYEGTWQELIGIYIKETAMAPILTEEVITNSGGIGSTWEATIEIHIITSDDSYCNYPPPDPGEAPDESTRFKGAENVLKVLKQLVFRIIGENRKGYESDTLATFQWDEAIFLSGELIDNYDGVKDMWAYIMTYTFECEVVSRT